MKHQNYRQQHKKINQPQDVLEMNCVVYTKLIFIQTWCFHPTKSSLCNFLLQSNSKCMNYKIKILNTFDNWFQLKVHLLTFPRAFNNITQSLSEGVCSVVSEIDLVPNGPDKIITATELICQPTEQTPSADEKLQHGWTLQMAKSEY